MTRPALLLLAAGASSRMRGTDKLMQDMGGHPLLADRAKTALATGLPVWITLPPQEVAPARWAALAAHDVTRVAVPNAADGMAASLKAGLKALPASTPAVLILLADMPEITARDIAALLAAQDGDTILRGAAVDGTPGHPVLIPARDFAALQRLSGDQGARDFLRRETARLRLVPLPDAHAITDLDTPEDFAAWRAKP